MYPKGYDPNKFVSDPGSRYAPVFQGDVKRDGQIELVCVGTDDLWELHNANADSYDVNNIVKRFQSGDISALNRVQGTYLDLTGMPNDLRGMYDFSKALEKAFYSMDSDLQAKFDNSFETWLKTAGSSEWFESMKKEQAAAAAEEGVNADEQK